MFGCVRAIVYVCVREREEERETERERLIFALPHCVIEYAFEHAYVGDCPPPRRCIVEYLKNMAQNCRCSLTKMVRRKFANRNFTRTHFWSWRDYSAVKSAY